MAYNLLGQQGAKGDRNPDLNLTAEQATYLYDTPPGQGDNKGVTNSGKPVDESDVKEKLEEVGEPIRFTDGDDEETVVTTTTNNISEAQTLLNNAGFNPGVIDGINGPNTKAAAEAYINASRGQDELNKRRREVGFILGIEAPTTTTTTVNETIVLYDKNGNAKKFLVTEPWKEYVESGTLFYSDPTKTNNGVKGGKTLNEILTNLKSGPSISADITDYELDKLAVEYGDSDSTLESVLNLSLIHI